MKRLSIFSLIIVVCLCYRCKAGGFNLVYYNPVYFEGLYIFFTHGQGV
ncbi:hypothetical protein [Caldicoprobacter algeriensis]|nr:hypothetical protein [Caldicoprobacter algeriensis]